MEFNLTKALEDMARNAVLLTIGGEDGVAAGRFGGVPDVPPDFQWPCYETAVYGDDTVKPRPLSFLAQFDCAALTFLDPEGLLPETGLLSFFYEMNSQAWGFDPKDAGCARVFWFPDASVLAPAEFPDALLEDYRFPEMDMQAFQGTCWPDFQDFAVRYPDIAHPAYWEQVRGGWDGFCEEFDQVKISLQGDAAAGHKLLGWPDIIQNNMTQECELVRRGHYLGNTWKSVSQEERQETAAPSLEDWRLLFQLDSFGTLNFSLDFGDCGSIYFYIRKDDLAARRFERAWLILQCY